MPSFSAPSVSGDAALPATPTRGDLSQVTANTIRGDQGESQSSLVLSIEDITAALGDASLVAPEYRLVIACPQHPNSGKSESFVHLSQKIGDRDIFGVLQTTRDGRCTIEIPLDDEVLAHHPNMIRKLACSIVYHPKTDCCLLVNESEVEFQLTNLESSLIEQFTIRAKERSRTAIGSTREIQPSVWRISVAGDHGETYLFEVMLLKRHFNIRVHDPPQSKRIVSGSIEDSSTPKKRQKLDGDDARELSGPKRTDASESDYSVVSRRQDSGEDDHPSSQEVENKVCDSILDLKDGGRLNIEAPQTGTASEDIFAAELYELRRIRQIGDYTPNTSVFICRHSAITGDVVAKVPRYEDVNMSRLDSFVRSWGWETKTLEKLSHRNIVSLKAMDGRMLAIYLEALPKSLVLKGKDKHMRSDARIILHDIASALAYMGIEGVIHNDIKPLNISYSPDRGAVLLDFGMASRDEAEKRGGTRWYTPEVATYGGPRGSPGDIWALGITMLYVLGKIDLPESMREFKALGKKNDRPLFKRWLNFIASTRAGLDQEDDIECLVYRMLEPKSELRIQATEIESALAEVRREIAS